MALKNNAKSHAFLLTAKHEAFSRTMETATINPNSHTHIESMMSYPELVVIKDS